MAYSRESRAITGKDSKNSMRPGVILTAMDAGGTIAIMWDRVMASIPFAVAKDAAP
jgi:hypothetical protein